MQSVVEKDFLSAFKPTDRMIVLKEKLHNYLPTHVLGKLSPDNISQIKGYLYPCTIEEINTWCIKYPEFWFWLVIPSVQVIQNERLKSRAMDVIEDILNGNIADTKLASVQINAARILLSDNRKSKQQVTNNNLSIPGANGAPPKHLAKKSIGELQAEIQRLASGSLPSSGEDT